MRSISPMTTTTTTTTTIACLVFSSLMPQASLSASSEWYVNPADGSMQPHQEVCSLYLAPSALPKAGLGIYTGVPIAEGDWIGYDDDGHDIFQDLLLPILDKCKTLPHRGNQRFLSWLGYVWPTKPDVFYPSFHDGTSPPLSQAFYKTPQGLNGINEGPIFYYKQPERDDNDRHLMTRLNAFVPGIASLANSHEELFNIEFGTSLYEYSPHSAPTKKEKGVSFVSLDDIPAGSELYLYYGDDWHDRHEIQERAAAEYGDVAEYDTLEEYLEDTVTEEDFHYDDLTEQDQRDRLPKMREQLASKQEQLDQIEQQRRLDVARLLEDREKAETKNIHSQNAQQHYSRYTESTSAISASQQRKLDLSKSHEESNEENSKEGKDDIAKKNPKHVQDLDWLQSNGVCLDHLRVGTSAISQAGRGAFANRFLPQNSVVAHAPLLALRRNDLKIDTETTDKECIDLVDGIIVSEDEQGAELLLNYCFGHPESDLLLFPYTPVVNFINHHSDSSKVNVKIQWPSDETAQRLLERRPQDWLDKHPLDVTDESGRLLMEFVALRDIRPGEEIFMNYGPEWQTAWEEHVSNNQQENKAATFRHEILVPDGFYPSNWLNQVMEYEIDPIDSLRPGELVPLRWKHNGQQIAKSAFVVGLPDGFTQHVKAFADERGINSLYKQLLVPELLLDQDEWFVFDADQHKDSEREGATEQWFAQRFKTQAWGLNVHYIGPWNQAARTSLFRNLGSAGFDVVLESIGDHFGLESITCFLESFIGVSQAENSFMHTDVYATGDKGFNILFPVITVDGSHPELDIQSDNADLVVAIKYEHDRAVVMSDWGYHRTSTVAYEEEEGEVRVVVGLYCAQMDETNHKMLKYIYTGERPAPFYDQFDLPIEEYQWGKGHSLPR